MLHFFSIDNLEKAQQSAQSLFMFVLHHGNSLIMNMYVLDDCFIKNYVEITF